jgi:hypothetical protein
LALQKMEKALFVGQNKNQPLWRSSPSQGPRTCPIWLIPINYATVMPESSSFRLKLMNLERGRSFL